MNTNSAPQLPLLIHNYLETMRAERYAPQTVDKYDAILKLFLRYLNGGHHPLSQVSAATIAGFFSNLTCGKKTALNYHTTLSAFWRWCVQNGLATENLVRATLKIRPPSPVEIVPLTRLEVSDILKAASNGNTPKRDEAMILLLLDTGIRVGELCALELNDIFWVTRKSVIQHGKGDKKRELKFSERTHDALITYLDSRGITDRKGKVPLFVTREKKGFCRNRVRKILDKLSRDSGVPRLHAHRFRHTFALEFLRNGGSIYTLQKILDHTTLDMCKRYLKLSQIDLDRDIDKASPVKNWGI